MAIAQVVQCPLTWAPVRLIVYNVQFDEGCLGAEVKMYTAYRDTNSIGDSALTSSGTASG